MKNVCIELSDDDHRQLLENADAAGFTGPSDYIKAMTLNMHADNDVAHAKLRSIATLVVGQTFTMRQLFSKNEWNAMSKHQRLSIARSMHKLVASSYAHLAYCINPERKSGAALFVCGKAPT